MPSTLISTGEDVIGDLPFIRKSNLYLTEKAYTADCRTDDIPQSNVKTDLQRGVTITDLRPTKDQYNFFKHGFQIVNFDSSLKYTDFFDDDKLDGVYCVELGRFMKQLLGASLIHVFESQVRQRDASFPYQPVQDGLTFQPAMRPHIDSSKEDTKDKIMELNGPSGKDILKTHRWVYFHLRKPLKGPLRDWPLAMCNPCTVNAKTDTIPIDNVVKGESSKTLAIHYNPKQKWMYLSNQLPNELLMFRQSDSEGRNGVPHCSFELKLPEGETAERRESIEVRMIAYFKK